MAFLHPDEFAQIVNLPKQMIIDLGHMIDAFASGYELDPEKFQAQADDWLNRFHETDMTWNYPSPYLHMLLVHGADLIRASPVAPGIWSEVIEF